MLFVFLFSEEETLQNKIYHREFLSSRGQAQMLLHREDIPLQYYFLNIPLPIKNRDQKLPEFRHRLQGQYFVLLKANVPLQELNCVHCADDAKEFFYQSKNGS